MTQPNNAPPMVLLSDYAIERRRSEYATELANAANDLLDNPHDRSREALQDDLRAALHRFYDDIRLLPPPQPLPETKPAAWAKFLAVVNGTIDWMNMMVNDGYYRTNDGAGMRLALAYRLDDLKAARAGLNEVTDVEKI